MLEVKNIKKSFGQKVVLKDVSFAIKEGEIKVLMGPNGSGKTTLFNIISGFLKAEYGSVLLNGKPILNKHPHEINKSGISRSFQDLRLISGLTVIENLLLAFPNQAGEKWWNALWPRKKIIAEQFINKSIAVDLLHKCFIDELAEKKAGEISFGQQKLLTLACLLANNSPYILLDELVAGVNQVYLEKLISVIKTLKNEEKAILIIEHNTDFIDSIADEILFLNGGILKSFESYNSFKQDNSVQEAFI